MRPADLFETALQAMVDACDSDDSFGYHHLGHNHYRIGLGVLAPGVVLIYSKPKGDVVEIENLVSLERGTGNASRAFRNVCRVADDCGVTLTGFVRAHAFEDDYAGTTRPIGLGDETLMAWYARLGFVRDVAEEKRRGTVGWIVRVPEGTDNRRESRNKFAAYTHPAA